MIATVYKVDYLNCDGNWLTFPENYSEGLARAKVKEFTDQGYTASVRKEFIFKR